MEGWRERLKQTPHWAWGSTWGLISGLRDQDPEIMTWYKIKGWTLNPLSHPGTPFLQKIFLYFTHLTALSFPILPLLSREFDFFKFKNHFYNQALIKFTDISPPLTLFSWMQSLLFGFTFLLAEVHFLVIFSVGISVGEGILCICETVVILPSVLGDNLFWYKILANSYFPKAQWWRYSIVFWHWLLLVKIPLPD